MNRVVGIGSELFLDVAGMSDEQIQASLCDLLLVVTQRPAQRVNSLPAPIEGSPRG